MGRSITQKCHYVHKVFGVDVEFLKVGCKVPPQLTFAHALTLGFDLSCCAVWMKPLWPESRTMADMVCAYPTRRHEQLFARRVFELGEGCNAQDIRLRIRVIKYLMKGFTFNEGSGIAPVTPGLFVGQDEEPTQLEFPDGNYG